MARRHPFFSTLVTIISIEHMLSIFTRTSSALIYTLISQNIDINKNNVVRFVLRQYSRMPDIYRLSILILTIIFCISTVFSTGSLFYNLSPVKRAKIINNLKKNGLMVRRNLIRFYESLVIVYSYSQK